MLNIKNNFLNVPGIALILAVALVAGGCKKSFLDSQPQGQLPAVQLYTNATGATQGINAIYSYLGSYGETAFPALAIESMGGDEVQKGSTPGDSPNMGLYHTFTQTGAEAGFDDSFWDGEYTCISLCNQAIDSIPKINMDATLKARYIAEAKFVRAYQYFRLARAYGDVPLRLHYPKSAADYNIARTPRAQVYAQVEQDLTDAASVLPKTYSGLDIGRATMGAALALHAKVAMYQANRWSDVLNYTNQVIAEGIYSLFPNFEQSFREINENNSEEIFEIQNANTQANPNASYSQFSQVQGIAPTYGWGFNVPTSVLVNAFETGDPRLNGTILFAGGTSAEGDAIPALGNGHVDTMYNYKSYVPFSDIIISNPGAGQDVRVIRYADVLLMNAEAANNGGNTTLALADLELVRARARGGNAAVLPAVTTTDKTALQTAIWHERQVELAMESDRFFDVIRQGRAPALWAARGFVAGKNELQPLPASEIVLSGGLLKQNPGYPSN